MIAHNNQGGLGHNKLHRTGRGTGSYYTTVVTYDSGHPILLPQYFIVNNKVHASMSAQWSGKHDC